jgi:hypothetical protein
VSQSAYLSNKCLCTNRCASLVASEVIVGPSRLEVEIPIAKLKKYKSPGRDEIRAELIQAGGEMLLSAIHKLINSMYLE